VSHDFHPLTGEYRPLKIAKNLKENPALETKQCRGFACEALCLWAVTKPGVASDASAKE
jgi:hypothetical protein